MSTLPKIINQIQFGLLSPDDIRKMSVTRIITADTYDEDGLPIDSGLMDGRLGTIEPGQTCKSCGNRVGECPGHFGHIELARPVIHVGFAKIIQKTLRAICRDCSRLSLNEDERQDFIKKMDIYEEEWGELDPELVKEVLKKATKTNTCPDCGKEKLKIRLEKPTTYYEEHESGAARLTPSDIRAILEKMPDEDCRLIGVNPDVVRPEWMILIVLPVPPVAVRPSITLESGVRSEDDLTHKLVDIIRINQRLSENIEAGAPQLIVDDLWELLQYHVTTFFDNEVSGIPPARHRSGRALRTLSQRLKGKEGRFRSNLSGKRVDFSARTVISPDPNLGINEVGVPEEVAQILTIPERVTEWNIEEMRDLVMRGHDDHPGANYIIRSDGRRVDLRFVKDKTTVSEALRPGYVVERHLKNGDIVLFNRQPSLHRMSIMGHEVKVMPFRTFRLNLCVCLSGDTEVYTDLGRISIENLVKDYEKYSPLSCNWGTDKTTYFSEISEVHAINPKQLGLKSYEITTKTGRIIKATEDHPFYSKQGNTRAGDLKIGDLVAVYPIEIPESGGCPPVLTEEQVLEAIPENVYIQYTINELAEMELLDIPAGTKKQIYLASLVGHLFGDGSLLISYEGGRVVFRASDYEDILSLYDTVTKLNLQPTGIQEFQSRGIPIQQTDGNILIPEGKTYFFEVRRKPVAIAFKALGVPVGDKVTQEYRLPEWLFDAPKMAKRAFLRAYFGAELSTPRLHTKSKSKFNQPILKFAKIEGLRVDNFIQDIKTLLAEFNIEISSIYTESGNLRKDGKSTVIYALNFAASDENLLALYKKIGYEFARAKEELARLTSEYITAKNTAKAKATAQLSRAKELREQGLTYEAIANEINHESWHTVASWIRNERIAAGLPASFPEFPKWMKSTTEGLKNGFVWDTIVNIEEIDLEVAYDITINDDNHNFIAEDFLTRNCPPYNADFDGDEMNLHVPQSEEARAEARILMRVEENILSPRYGGPIIGALQDYISAGFLLTRKNAFFTKKDVCQLFFAAGFKEDLPPPTIQKPVKLWSGKQLLSTLIPSLLNLTLTSKACIKCKVCEKDDCPNDAYVIIRNGKLMSGVIDKKTLGAGQANSLLHRIVKDYGSQKAREFLDSITRLLLELITSKGFTLGLDDVDLSAESKNMIDGVLRKAEEQVDELIRVYRRGELERLPGRTLEETLEMRIMQELAEARDDAGTIAGRNLGLNNNAVIMATTGARGSNLNLAQMTACVGQQSVRGERIHRGYRERVLPHFKEGDLSAIARGFVKASYRSGLTPIEFFFHAMGGREGLVDTAVRTSTSGYMQRRLVNALQDIKNENDGTVRNAIGQIIQFFYGEDGVDPAKSDHGKAMNMDVIFEKILSQRRVEE